MNADVRDAVAKRIAAAHEGWCETRDTKRLRVQLLDPLRLLEHDEPA
jgi:hypothetical protein